MKSRYAELRKGALSLGNIITHVEEIYDLVSDRVFNDDKAKWIGLPSQSTNTITRFRNYMRDRAKYVDKCIDDLVEPIECTGIKLSSSSLTFETAENQTLTYTLTPTNTTQQVTWSVNPSGIVNVKEGVITPVSRGECIVTATCGSHSATCSVSVNCDITDEMEGYTRIAFNGSENWTIPGWSSYDGTSYGVYELNVNDYVDSTLDFPATGDTIPTFICDTLEPKTQTAMYNIPQEGICGTFYLGNKLIAISSLAFPKGNVDSLKEYLNQNNLVVYFKIK